MESMLIRSNSNAVPAARLSALCGMMIRTTESAEALSDERREARIRAGALGRGAERVADRAMHVALVGKAGERRDFGERLAGPQRRLDRPAKHHATPVKAQRDPVMKS